MWALAWFAREKMVEILTWFSREAHAETHVRITWVLTWEFYIGKCESAEGNKRNRNDIILAMLVLLDKLKIYLKFKLLNANEWIWILCPFFNFHSRNNSIIVIESLNDVNLKEKLEKQEIFIMICNYMRIFQMILRILFEELF